MGGGGGAGNAVHEERLGNIFRKNGSHPGLNRGPLTLAVSALPPELWPRAHVVLILSLRNSNETCMRGSTIQYNTSQHHKAQYVQSVVYTAVTTQCPWKE